MKSGQAIIKEIILLDDKPAARLLCAVDLIPAPGQYLLSSHASDSSIADSVFSSAATSDGFITVPSIPAAWSPGMTLNIRGPLGHGFSLPNSARHVALVAFDDSPRRLFPLIQLALKQDASIVLVSSYVPDGLSADVEVQPISALVDVLKWSTFSALDAARGSLSTLREMLGALNQASLKCEAQILIRAPMPCGALAECGVCAVHFQKEWKMTCKDGPVFNLFDLL